MHQPRQPGPRRAEYEVRGGGRQGAGAVRRRGKRRYPREARVWVGVVPPDGPGQGPSSIARHHRRAGRDDAINRTAGQQQAGRRVDYERRHDDRSPDDAGRIEGVDKKVAVRREVMRHLISSLLMVAALSPAQGKQTFTGTITDNMCAKAGHAQMRMGPTDAECTTACVSVHGATYVLSDGKEVYALSDQRTPEKFAGQKVRIT